MTLDEMADSLKKEELTEDELYIQEILDKESQLEKKIESAIAIWWALKKNKKKLYKEISNMIDETFDEIQDDLSKTLQNKYEGGYIKAAFLVQLITQKFENPTVSGDLKINWHMGSSSFIDDLNYYKKRLLNDIQKDIDRKVVLEAPINEGISSAKKPFNTLNRSTKAMTDTECTNAERQGWKQAYIDYEADSYRFLATLDSLTCEVCADLDGRIFKTKEAEVGVNYPPIHLHCRCVPMPVFSDFEDSTRSAKDENGDNILVNMTFEEWKRKYDVQI